MAATHTSKAKRLGREHGTNAAEWWVQDALTNNYRSADEIARLTLQGIDDGNPEVLDSLPWSELSADVYRALDIDWSTDPDMYLIDLYEAAFADAMSNAVIKACKRQLRKEQ